VSNVFVGPILQALPFCANRNPFKKKHGVKNGPIYFGVKIIVFFNQGNFMTVMNRVARCS
jgi:hypothetical protein